MASNMIFHYPLPVKADGRTGSEVRPYQMVRAFKEIGYDVELVAGYGADRKTAIKSVKKKYSRGFKPSFIYAESSTMPTMLTEKHHLPFYPQLDFAFFRWAKKESIPMGIFYRDIQWLYDFYRNQLSLLKRKIAEYFYRYDFRSYRELFDILYLPSLGMADVLPFEWPPERIKALPPGCVIEPQKNDREKSEGILNLIYVGGVQPPVYDLSPLFMTLDKLAGLVNYRLIINCRQEEWEAVKNYYSHFDLHKATINHFSMVDLKEVYRRADIFILLWAGHQYLDFAMPVKLFEAIGQSLPIITLTGTEAARFISREGSGWVVENIAEAVRLLHKLSIEPELIRAKENKILSVQNAHTWKTRAATVAESLVAIRN